MRTPDPRPAGETALIDEQVARIIGEVEARVGMGHGAWDMVKPGELVEGFRAALLAGAPAVWVATDGPDGNGWPSSVTLFVSAPRWEEEWRAWCPPSDGVGTTLSRHLAVELGVPPGTCVRYRLVPDPEGTP